MILLVMITFQSCGTSTVEVEGVPERVDIVHSIDFSAMKEVFTEECQKRYDTQVEIDLCIDEKIGDLLEFIEGYDNGGNDS